MTTYNYENDAPVTDFFKALEVKDLDSLSTGSSVSSWGGASAVGSPTYDNTTDSFPFVTMNSTGFTFGTQTIDLTGGFTFVGLKYTTSLTIYPVHFYYGNSSSSYIRLYRTGSSGELIRFFVVGGGETTQVNTSNTLTATINTWQVMTCRIKDNGDSTYQAEFYIDNALQTSETITSSNISSISGVLALGTYPYGAGSDTNDAKLSNTYFYNRALSDTELTSMQEQ